MGRAVHRALPWKRIFDFLEACAIEHDLHRMVRVAVTEVSRLMPCDQAFGLFMDLPPSGRMRFSLEQHGIPESACKPYLDYYVDLDVAKSRSGPGTAFYEFDYRERQFNRNEFVQDWVRRIWKMDMSAGLPIYDYNGPSGLAFGIARSGSGSVSPREEEILLLLRPHLANLYTLRRRLQELSEPNVYAAELARESKLLSRREAEVASLLCKRLRPTEIATLLFISPRTVERHVENIYLKLNVRSRKELLARLLGGAEAANR